MPQDILIVAHGSPSDPAPQERAVAILAEKTQQHLSGRRVRGVTLAAPGSVEAALVEGPDSLIYPFFMAHGFFTDTVLPKRTPARAHYFPPFGGLPDLPGAVARRIMCELDALGWAAEETGLLIAAHGSAHGRQNATNARTFAARLSALTPMREAQVGFLEQAPCLETKAHGMARAICLPWFALRSSHVAGDVPKALEAAGFEGPILPPFIEWDETPALIAQDILRQSLPERVSA